MSSHWAMHLFLFIICIPSALMFMLGVFALVALGLREK